MVRLILLVLTLTLCIVMSAQDLIVVKKKGTIIQQFWTGSQFTFQTQDKVWLMGVITRITPDSFYLTQEVIRYTMMGIDTLHISGFHFAYSDVYALPTKKQMVVFRNDQAHIIEGHEKFVWIRNGFLFQVVGAGYAGLSITNDLIHNDPPFAKKNLASLGIAAGLFAIGQILHWHYYPYWRIGKKYKLEYRSLTGGPLREKKSF